jgi:hypothetical protein
MHGNTPPTPATPQGVYVSITNTGTYTLTIGDFVAATIAADNSDLLAEVDAALPEGWDVAYSDVQATSAELVIYPPSGTPPVSASVTGNATLVEMEASVNAYSDHLPQGTLYLDVDGNDLYILAPKNVENGVVRNAWVGIGG